MGESGPPVVELRDVRKSFGPVRALDGASLTARAGEVTALVGDNGSGKSTLVKVLTGLVAPDSGDIVVDGRRYGRLTPRQAIGLGVGALYQDLALDDHKDCAENVFMGREMTRAGFLLDRRAMRRETRRLLDALGVGLPDVRQKVGRLSGGQRQALAMARAVGFPHKVVVFDEPTSAMGVRETGNAMRIVAGLRDKGVAVILISHNLFQVFQVADRVNLMSSGRVVDTFLARESSPQQLWDAILSQESGAAR